MYLTIQRRKTCIVLLLKKYHEVDTKTPIEVGQRFHRYISLETYQHRNNGLRTFNVQFDHCMSHLFAVIHRDEKRVNSLGYRLGQSRCPKFMVSPTADISRTNINCMQENMITTMSHKRATSTTIMTFSLFFYYKTLRRKCRDQT